MLARLFVEHHPLRSIEPPIEVPRTSMDLGWHELHRDDPGHRWLREQLTQLAAHS